ncbi:hypothetical protein CAEBREN_23861 [Caenorhabditis brenneri]|uniref:EGF-like domain-containing protein n=1 Tax=Caenorhabditis brenneri TaxID=135651 RepID=G0NX11_CAEBE|nr:hypothetical protein CAEBREN_23861 [Caenorhabditis brenneri]
MSSLRQPATLSMCQAECHHQGTCWFFRGTYFCWCIGNFVGEVCDLISTTASSSIESGNATETAATGILLVFVAFGILACGVLFYTLYCKHDEMAAL